MSFNCIQTYTSTGSLMVYQLKEALKSQGWTVPRSSDGTTYNSSGDQISSGSSGAGGLANSSAWFVIQSPLIDGYQKSICFQKSTSGNLNWRIKYSFSAGFTGGSPGATQTPSATDEQVILGGGTNASPTYATWLPADAGYRIIFIIGGESEFYSFFCVTFPLGGGVVSSGFMFEAITSDSKIDIDIERHIIAVANGNFYGSLLSASATAGYTWYKKNLSGESFVRCPIMILKSEGSNWHSVLSNSAIGNRFSFLPVIFARLSSYGGNTGIKGYAKHLNFFSVSKNNPNTVSVVSEKDYLMLGDFVLPWNGEGVIT